MFPVILLLVSSIYLLAPCEGANTRLTGVFNWTMITYQMSPEEKKSALESGRYVPENNLALGIERWNNKLFITVPRFKSGVYSTLNYISLENLNGSNKSPDLIPYPNLDANTGTVSTWPPKLQSVCRIRVDSCDRLWVMDTGNIETLSQSKQQMPPTIFIYDLKTDKLLYTYVFKDKVDYNEDSYFPNIIVDVTSANCDHAYAYLPDIGNYKIIVYSLPANETHSVTHNYFHFDPLSGDFTSNGIHFQWQDGVFGMALSPVDRDGFRIVYFHALASTMEFAVSSKYLQNSTLAKENLKAFKVLGNRGVNGQSSASFLDEETGVLFYTQINKNGIGCWNSFKGEEYNDKSQGIVADDEETMSFPNDIKVDKTGILWVMNSPLPEFMITGLKKNAINFRVFMAPVRQAIKGTSCDEM